MKPFFVLINSILAPIILTFAELADVLNKKPFHPSYMPTGPQYSTFEPLLEPKLSVKYKYFVLVVLGTAN